MTMKFAWTLLILSVGACILFSLGRWVGKIDEINNQKNKKSRDKSIKADLLHSDFEEISHNTECEIAEEECETVVIDLERYKGRRSKA